MTGEIENRGIFTLSITAESVTSTDEQFTMDNLGLGDGCQAVDVYFKSSDGTIAKYHAKKNEKKISNRTLPRIAFQIFEKQLIALPDEEKRSFPICKYNPDAEVIRGIYPNEQEFKKYHNTIERVVYHYGDGRQFVTYCWSIFSTIVFVQECLKRFGDPKDQFVLTYRVPDREQRSAKEFNEYRNVFSAMLLESENLIFRGAPGTGKSHLAKSVAADIVSNGSVDDYTLLTDDQKKQVEFVQFHPSYDYSDFVEGLRPKINVDGTMGFELRDGVFKRFVARARENYENSQKSMETVEKEASAHEAMKEFFSEIEFGEDTFRTVNGSRFTVTGVDDDHVGIAIPGNATANRPVLNLDEIRKMLESGREFEKVKDITSFFKKEHAQQGYSYDFAIYKEIKAKEHALPAAKTEREPLKKYVFIIDEINRGETSKIFGELFFSMDPGYRGKAGEISTQYANLHSDPDERFYIPENVYIIGTMNDIDRSVDSFDFAMRRRFRFVELKANEHLGMLESLEDEALKKEAIKRMRALNDAIAEVEDLNENYQIGAAYFLKLKTLGFDQLWTDYLQPLLKEYVQGMYDEEGLMSRFAKAYGYGEPVSGDVNEAAQH